MKNLMPINEKFLLLTHIVLSKQQKPVLEIDISCIF
jgi:hypothetical protein